MTNYCTFYSPQFKKRSFFDFFLKNIIKLCKNIEMNKCIVESNANNRNNINNTQTYPDFSHF